MAAAKGKKRSKRRKTQGKKLNWFFVLTASLFLSLCCFITLAPYLELPFEVPTWDAIFAAAELDNSGDISSDDPLRVHYIDVGQGDSILIQYKTHSMLIDAGENGTGEQIAAYLKKHGVKKLDYIIATHPHSDHIGGMDELLNLIPARELFMLRFSEEMTPTTRSYTSLLQAIYDNNVKLTDPKIGQVISFGDAELTLYPPQAEYENMNNMSIAAQLDYGDTSFLFMGDAEKEREKELIRLNADLTADVLKVGHHGSSTSSSADFIKAVSPNYAVISCGRDNDYGHPAKKTLKNLSGIQIYRTDYSGTVIITSDGRQYTINEEKSK